MSSKITQKTLNDLEFNTVIDSIGEYCGSDLGRKAVQKIRPISAKLKLLEQLQLVNEYLGSFENDNKIPNHHFEEITEEIHLLNIENSFLEANAFLKIVAISETVNLQLKFLKKFQEYYPTLFKISSEIPFTRELIEAIRKVINNFGEVDNKASDQLKRIRKEINSVRAKISTSFSSVLSRYAGFGYLDDIRESVIESQRVLAVLAMHRRKVKGSILGTSKTGSIVFIVPDSTAKLNRELQDLIHEEQEEIIRILKKLSDVIRPHIELLNSYQDFLTALDSIAARAKYAQNIGGLLPKISNTKKLFLKDAFHPILLKNNRELGLETVPQTLELNNKQQIIVISGPNAGGKSITLKTIGLLQVMVQSGILIPVHERSEVYFFDTILSDIGDNQSIENQLSTYSYRLKNMRNFLRKCNANTLFLIDEFGTGSDPELGGALAEIFLEEFYEKGAYGIITTHYANLKVLADELENVTNANMQFDAKTLEPTFKLYVGQAGSSFTFEVAQKNGIPFSLINRAKKKVEPEKIRLDRTISKLQQERNKLRRTSADLEKAQNKAQEHTETLSDKEKKVQEKLESFQQLYESNQKMLTIGRKFNELSNKYFQTNNKKQFIADVMKWAAIEKSKHQKKNKPKTKTEKKAAKKHAQQQKQKLEEVKKEVLEEVKKVQKVKALVAKKIAKEKADYTYKLNDRVRLIDSNSVGTIEKIEKNKATINYGLFTTKTSLDKLELVEAAKK
ncbi:MAG: DNA mismatch repair protein MutS [Flavobacteriaceae bacterium]|nr:DNA mismatch repair protein MutS [Flavobacteriaceae bacterium]